MTKRDRRFARSTIKYGGTLREVATAKCCRCSAKATANSRGSNGKHLPPEAILNQFRNQGWRMGKKANKDYCPNCKSTPTKECERVTKQQAATAVARVQAANQQPQLNIEPQKAEAPRTMTRTYRRLILARLDEVYLDDRYETGWSDKRLSEELKIPRSWVSMLREENFGDSPGDDRVEKTLEELNEIRSDLKAKVGDINQLIEIQVKAFHTRLDRVQQQVSSWDGR